MYLFKLFKNKKHFLKFIFDSFIAIQHICSCNSELYVMIVQTFARREIWRFDLLNSYGLEYVMFPSPVI